MVPLVDLLAENYAASITAADDILLQELANYTQQHHPHAHMLSGSVQGQFLQMLSKLLQPKNILEIGTFTGYSALCLAAGLQKEGALHTIELRDADATTAQGFFNQSAYKDQIVLHLGNAVDIIPQLNFNWDLVFLDADKTGYIDYYELILPALRTNGLIIADNVLFHGEVLKMPLSGKNAKAVDAFNQHVKQDDRTEQVLLTVRDGLLLIRKK